MPTKSSLDRIARKAANLENRIQALLHTISAQLAHGHHDATERKHSNSAADTRAAVHSLPSPEHESLFELLLETVVQGYRQLGNEEYLSAESFIVHAKNTLDLVLFTGRDGIIRSANRSLLDRLGFRPDQLFDRAIDEFVEPPYGLQLNEVLQRRNHDASDTHQIRPNDIVVFRLLHSDGSYLSVAAIVAALDGEIDTRAIVMRDVSIHRRLIEELRESRDNYDALSETISEAIIRINEDFEIVFANSAVRTTFGFEPSELHGEKFSILFPESVYKRNEPEFRKYFVIDDRDRRRVGLQNTIEILGKQKNRGVAPMEISFGNSKDVRGRTLTCIVRDITQRKNAERRLRHLAYHDQLTGLGNRDLYENDMHQLLGNSGIFKVGYAALLFLDLDGFKQVNDTIGHDAGDALLIQAATRLRKTLRESDGIYRFGGDEFVVLLSFIKDRRGAAVVANSILGEIRQPFQLSTTKGSSTSVSVGVSIGVAIIPDDGVTLTTVTKAADLAMYSAKEAGKNRFVFYDPKLETRAHDRWSLEQGIRGSLERQEFQMSYQPLLDNAGIMVGVEALLRWNSPEHGQVSPYRFMPVAEETGMIIPLGSWAIETALRDANQWPLVNGRPLLVSVNLSPKQFEQHDLPAGIGRVINRAQIDPSRVIVEVTETCVMSAPEQAIATLRLLKERYPGLSVAIDDFGTGYSSLSYLTRLPADIIKIDLSFVSNLFSQNNEKVVQAIIELAHSLDMRIIAEGVETAEQHEFFLDKGCFAFQGYHFYEPIPADRIAEVINAYRSFPGPSQRR